MATRCDVCGKEISVGIFHSSYGGRCKYCDRDLCTKHYQQGMCPYCKEKMGKK